MKWLHITMICAVLVGTGYLGNFLYKAAKYTREDHKYVETKQCQGIVTDKKFEERRRESYMGMDMNGHMKMKWRTVSEKNYIYINWKHGTRTINNKTLFNQVKIGDPVVVTYKVGHHTGKIFYKSTEKGELNEPYTTY